jgi:hypothetical protein
MKLNNKMVYCLSVTIFFTSLTGCGSISRVESLGGGYEVVAYTRHSFSEPEATQITLQYRKPSGGRIMIWPETLGVIETNDAVLFIGYKAYDQPPSDEPRATRPRLFIVQAPNLPLDISEEILWRQAKQSGGDLAIVLKKPSVLKKVNIHHVGETNNILELRFEIEDVRLNGVIHVDWHQILDVMREVKEKGVVRKDRVWGTSYIEKEFKPQENK